MSKLSIFIILIPALLLSGCTTVKASAPTATANPPVTVIATVKPSPAPTVTVTVPATNPDYEKRLKEAEGKLAGFKALQENYNTLSSRINKLETQNKTQQSEIDNLKKQIRGEHTLNFIDDDGVQAHTVLTTNTINGLVAGVNNYCDFYIRIFNNSGFDITNFTISGNIKSNIPMSGLAAGYPFIIDASNTKIQYNNTFDGNNLCIFEVISTTDKLPINILKNSSLDFRPRIVLYGPATTKVWTFNLYITDITFNKK